MDCSRPGFSVHGGFPNKNTRVSFRALLQGIFPTQGLSTGLPHCRWILYHLSHPGSPTVLEWVACSFSRELPTSGIKLGSPALLEDSLPAELPGKPVCVYTHIYIWFIYILVLHVYLYWGCLHMYVCVYMCVCVCVAGLAFWYMRAANFQEQVLFLTAAAGCMACPGAA